MVGYKRTSSSKKKICQLKIGKGLSNQEIADMMQITVPTVKSHYTQAIKLLRSAIEPLIMLLHAVWFYFLLETDSYLYSGEVSY